MSYRLAPDSVKIGAVTYDVIWTKQLKQRYGESSYRKSVIHISPKQSEAQLRDTFIHECIHLMLQNGGPAMSDTMRLTVNATDQWDAVEELICAALSPRWHAFVLDNPDAVAWIAESPR
jgi:hypothetical protein